MRVRQLLAAVGTGPKACRHAHGAAWEGGAGFRRRIKGTLRDRCKMAARWAGICGSLWLALRLRTVLAALGAVAGVYGAAAGAREQRQARCSRRNRGGRRALRAGS